MSGHGSQGLIAVAGESIAAAVGAGIAARARFRPVAAWAWMWRSFDALPLDGFGPPAEGRPVPDPPFVLWPGAVSAGDVTADEEPAPGGAAAGGEGFAR
ncbi:hypothetical protein ACWEGQ_04500 [Streptomyces seoulensis]